MAKPLFSKKVNNIRKEGQDKLIILLLPIGKISALLLILIFLFTACASAETSIKAGVDKTKITTDEIITYKLTIASTAKRIPQPKLPAFEGFIVVSRSQSSETSISHGLQKSSLAYIFMLAATKTGKFKIGPAQVQIEGEEYSSDTFEIEITQGKARPQTKPEGEPNLPEINPQEPKEPQFTL